jgi:hypothetical protein
MQFSHYLAHNGIYHASETEASTHQSGSVLLLIGITLVTILVMFAVVKFLGNERNKDEEK